MRTFEDLVFEEDLAGIGGQRAAIFFGNGYGVSVIKTQFSYGGKNGLWEMAVLAGVNDKESYLRYDTPVTSDVLGHLTEADVTEKMAEVQQLKES